MWLLWIEFATLAAGAVVYILYTIVFWFWLIYLVDAMKRKRGYYKTTLRCIEVEQSGPWVDGSWVMGHGSDGSRKSMGHMGHGSRLRDP